MTTEHAAPAPAAVSSTVAAAMRRYRVSAFVVGVGLLALVVAMLFKYIGGEDLGVAIIGPTHGFLYMAYLVFTADLAIKARWPVGKVLLVALAGTIPFVSFVAERRVTAPLREGASDPAAVPRG